MCTRSNDTNQSGLGPTATSNVEESRLDPVPSTALFRQAATQAVRGGWTGSVVLITPLPASLLVAFAVLLIVAIGALVIFGEYSKRATVTGYVEPVGGIVKIFSAQSGLIVEKRVVEGQAVQRGDILYVISEEKMTRRNGTPSGEQSQISAALMDRQSSLTTSAERTDEIYQRQARALTTHASTLRDEIAEVTAEFELQSSRLTAMNADLTRYQALADQGFFARSVLEQKRGEALDQDGKLHGLRRDLESLKGDLATTLSELDAAPAHLAKDQAELHQQSTIVAQDIAATEASRQTLVVAPTDGTITTILGEVGQMAGTQPLLTILPRGAVLQARLFVPTRSIGFVSPGQKVLLRFLAFPYQKFGQYEGAVSSRAKSALSASELPIAFQSQAQQTTESYYPVTVALKSQTIRAYGQPEALSVGMLLEADVIQDRRTIGEWLLEPLLGWKGRF